MSPRSDADQGLDDDSSTSWETVSTQSGYNDNNIIDGVTEIEDLSNYPMIPEVQHPLAQVSSLLDLPAPPEPPSLVQHRCSIRSMSPSSRVTLERGFDDSTTDISSLDWDSNITQISLQVHTNSDEDYEEVFADAPEMEESPPPENTPAEASASTGTDSFESQQSQHGT